ncbi:MAG TPA: AAA family ATPase [Ktedonobacteraceae bacterium]|nr:AAA family ATPase [Ktedonobacteraceae bacterium]
MEDVPTSIESTKRSTNLSSLLAALRRLDGMLEQACSIVQELYGPARMADPFRGLHISQTEVEQLLASPPVSSLLFVEESYLESYPVPRDDEDGALTWLVKEFDLSPFDVDVLMIALAPDIDLRYERLYAYLQDDVSRKRPGVDLALNLLCATSAGRLAARPHFSSGAPLVKHGLLHLIAEPSQLQPSLLSHYLKLDEQVVNLLLAQPGVSASISAFARLQHPEPASEGTSEQLPGALTELARQSRKEASPLRLFFHGQHGVGKLHTARQLATCLHMPLLIVDLSGALNAVHGPEQIFKRIFLEARFQDALLYLENVDGLSSDKRTLQCMLDALSESKGITILASTQAHLAIPTESRYRAADVIPVHFPMPAFVQRRRYWQMHLGDDALALEVQVLDDLATHYRLTSGQIRDAVVSARQAAAWRTAGQPTTQDADSRQNWQPTPEELYSAARRQSSHTIEALARKIEPRYSWDDIVLPHDQLAQLKEICNQARYRHIVYGEWGFELKMHLGKDLNVLLSGLPGTGKTMAAEVIAHTLALDLYKIDLSQVVSKYIGETEKNLDRIFTAAESTNAILFFDEADTLFGKRSQVHDAHDRYANIEVGYLLQKMEEYNGITILATNLRNNMDDAFIRRLKFSVELPFPDEASRYRIWRGHFPATAPLGDDIDFAFLARQFKLAGGSIKNIILNASFLAAAEEQSIHMKHLILAARREFQKMGKTCSEAIFGEYFALISDI